MNPRAKETGRIFDWLDRLSLRAKLWGGFAFLIGLTLVVGLVSLQSQRNAGLKVEDFLDKDSMVAELSLRSKAAMLEARRAEKDFLLFKDEFGHNEARTRYVTLLRNSLGEVRNDVREIRQLASDLAMVEITQEVLRSVGEYETTFLEVVALYGQLGFTDTGLEGRFRSKAHEIEAILQDVQSDRLMMELLSLRRNEKDFLRRNLEQYAEDFASTIDRFKANVTQSRLPLSTTEKLRTLADEYSALFEQYRGTRADINSRTATYLRAAHRVEPLLEALHARTTDSAIATRKTLADIAQNTVRAIVGFSLTAALFGIAVAFLISRNITQSVGDFMLLAERVASGDLSMRITPRGRQEFGRLAKSLNYMTDSIQRYQKELEHQANYDTLTGLANRNLVQDRITLAGARARRNHTMVAVAIIDLDHFKLINNGLGHPVGDEVLKAVAERLRACVRETDTVARLGADEFLLVLPDLADENAAAAVVRRVAETLVPYTYLNEVLQRVFRATRQPIVIDDQELVISCSIGVCLFPNDGMDAHTLIKNADAAMYQAKARGRDNVQFFSAEMNDRIGARLALHTMLRRALERQEFELHYQPKIELESGRIAGLEALIRWNRPNIGMVPPSDFLPVLEETGLIINVGRWVMETAAADYARWRHAGRNPPRIAVNVSQIQLRQDDFTAIAAAVVQTVADGAGLDIEVTESLVMEQVAVNSLKLKALREMGIGIAVDDFGTGYSSLSYLATLPVNALKIDRAFITNISTDPANLSIVTTIIALAHSMNLKVIAEGVETREQAQILRQLRCDEIQGYLVARPMPSEAYLEWEDRYLSAATTPWNNVDSPTR
jgi:diguanylate cyclase (GGDEF)-like protein